MTATRSEIRKARKAAMREGADGTYRVKYRDRRALRQMEWDRRAARNQTRASQDVPGWAIALVVILLAVIVVVA